MKIKIFKFRLMCEPSGDEASEQKAVQDWLDENPNVEIHHTLQSQGDGYRTEKTTQGTATMQLEQHALVITLFYTEKK